MSLYSSPFPCYWLSGVLGGGLFSFTVGWPLSLSQAQIIPDATLGSEQSLVRSVDANTEQIEQGAQRGNNLFHSFDRFNVDDGQTVQFSPPGDVRRIFSRVTGNDVSDILGTLSILGSADLFFLNPNGIIWGPNAKLDINGSLIASTADAIAFANGGLFSAANPDNSVLLSVQPNAFFFNNRESRDSPESAESRENIVRGGILHQAVQNPDELDILMRFGLQVPTGETIGFLGGAIALEEGVLNAPDGRIELGSVTDGSQVALERRGGTYQFQYDDAEVSGFGSITLRDQALLSVDGQGGGNVQLRGHQIQLTSEAVINADTAGVSRRNAGEITLYAQADVLIDEGSTIFANTFESGHGTSIVVTADQLQLLSGGQIGTGTAEGSANGGTVDVTARTIELTGFYQREGVSFIEPSVIDAGVFTGSNGRGGDLNITTETLRLRNRGRIATTVGGNNAQGGNLTIDAAQGIEVRGRRTGIAADVARDAVNGQGGNLQIRTDDLLLVFGGRVSTSLNGPGAAGELNIEANRIRLIQGDSPSLTGILSQSNRNAQGNAGAIFLETSRLLLRGGAEISARNLGEGAAGNIFIGARDRVLIDGSTISALVNDNAGIEKPAQVRIEAGELIIANEGTIDSSLDLRGRAGSISIVAGSIEIDSNFFEREIETENAADFPTTTKIQSVITAPASGVAGSIEIDADTLSIRNGGGVSTEILGVGLEPSRIVVNARNIELSGTGIFQPSDFARLPSRISTRISGPGEGNRAGDIEITTDQLTLRDGGQIGATSQGEGAAGNITINAQQIRLIGVDPEPTIVPEGIDADPLILASGFITTTESSEDGGNIVVNVDDFLLLDGGAQISTSAGIESADDLETNATRRRTTRVDGTTQGGSGGNITFNLANAALVGIRNSNSDITANAFDGSGGRVEINAAGIIGFTPQTRSELVAQLGTDDPTELDPINLSTNDITSFSQTNATLSGDIIITTNTDPDRTEALPSGLVDASNQIEQSLCHNADGSEFMITGQGGIQPSPREPFQSLDVWEDWRLTALPELPELPRLPELPELSRSSELSEQQSDHYPNTGDRALFPSILSPPPSPPSVLTEAQGWHISPTGEVMLVAELPAFSAQTITSHAIRSPSPLQPLLMCQSYAPLPGRQSGGQS